MKIKMSLVGPRVPQRLVGDAVVLVQHSACRRRAAGSAISVHDER